MRPRATFRASRRSRPAAVLGLLALAALALCVPLFRRSGSTTLVPERQHARNEASRDAAGAEDAAGAAAAAAAAGAGTPRATAGTASAAKAALVANDSKHTATPGDAARGRGDAHPSGDGAAAAAAPPYSVDGYSMLAIIATYDDNITWLLDHPASSNSPLIVPTEVYLVADLGGDCEPTSPVFRRAPVPPSPRPAWPGWAQAAVDAKCAYKDEVEPWSVYDEERAATLAAGLPWNPRRAPGAAILPAQASHQHLMLPVVQHSYDAGEDAAAAQGGAAASGAPAAAQAGAGGRALRQAAPSPAPAGNASSSSSSSEDGRQVAPSAVVTLPSHFPFPLHLIPGQGRESMAYLAALIDHYPELERGQGPDLLVFMHGHRAAWHTLDLGGQDWVLRRLRAGGRRNLTQGFMQLGCLERPESHMFTRVIDANHASTNGPRWRVSACPHCLRFSAPTLPANVQLGMRAGCFDGGAAARARIDRACSFICAGEHDGAFCAGLDRAGGPGGAVRAGSPARLYSRRVLRELCSHPRSRPAAAAGVLPGLAQLAAAHDDGKILGGFR